MLEVRDLSVKYGNHYAIENISFTLDRGDYLAVVGSNGSGKSTLIKSILGLVQKSSGTINFSRDLKVGYLPQLDESNENFPAKSIEVVKTGLLNQVKFPYIFNKSHRERLDEVFRVLKISSLKHKNFSELSGGQRQKVLLARAILASNELLIVDEPTNGLDQHSKEEMYSILKKLNDGGMTIIMITHDMYTSIQYANKILELESSVLYFGSNEDYQKRGVKNV